ncbi:cytochrome P450 [Micromonospora carbonacea]|uniref:cytochrome P450 n=1 Tax=Micromonospora carbonacea TaxID=47853 RepID=UPI003720ABB5
MTSATEHPAPADKRAAVAAHVLRRPAVLYEQLRRQGGLVWSDSGGCWLVVGYEPARLVLRDERFRMPGADPTSEWGAGARHGDFVRSLLLSAEGADHDRMRRTLGPAFSPRAVRSRREAVEATIDRLLADIGPDGRFDGVAAISGRLPVAVVGDLVGVPGPERDHASELCRTISQGGGLVNGPATESAVRSALTALDELTVLVRQWLTEPTPDSVLAAIRAAAGTSLALSETETVANVFSLYLAGHDTSRNMISALLLRLATAPELLDGLRDGRLTAEAEVDRVLLTESPLTFTARVAVRDVEVAGQLIRRGDRLRVMLGAANHELVTTDQPAGPLAGVAFGEGRHVCLGAHVARLEGVALLTVLARRWSTVRVAGAPRWTPHFLHRGLERLPLEATWC